jgi:hemoglobin
MPGGLDADQASARSSLVLARRVRPLVRMTDICSEADVRRLVDEFYAKVRADALLNPIFSDVAQVDWTHHLPKMYAFWNGMILGLPGYNGRPFPLHAVLPVDKTHFNRWLELFKATLDENFSGPGADRARNAAASIAHTFASRMGVIDPMAGELL